MIRFEMNSKAYETDEETLEVLRSIVPDAKENKNGGKDALTCVMVLGMQTGRVKEVK